MPKYGKTTLLGPIVSPTEARVKAAADPSSKWILLYGGTTKEPLETRHGTMGPISDRLRRRREFLLRKTT